MSVSELIEKLQGCPPDMEVMHCRMSEGGFHLAEIDDCEQITTSMGENYIVIHAGYFLDENSNFN